MQKALQINDKLSRRSFHKLYTRYTNKRLTFHRTTNANRYVRIMDSFCCAACDHHNGHMYKTNIVIHKRWHRLLFQSHHRQNSFLVHQNHLKTGTILICQLRINGIGIIIYQKLIYSKEKQLNACGPWPNGRGLKCLLLFISLKIDQKPTINHPCMQTLFGILLRSNEKSSFHRNEKKKNNINFILIGFDLKSFFFLLPCVSDCSHT